MSYSPDNGAPPPGDELPTYANLEAEAEAEGGVTAARWNRWRGWIEKRAAERYADHPNQSRRPTGWGPSSDYDGGASAATPEPTTPVPPKRQSTRLAIPPPDYAQPEPSGSQGQAVDPSRLTLHHFGSRFLPHATDKILCLLPVLLGQFLLIGTTTGLSVIDVHPSLHPKKGEQALALNTALTSAQPLADAVSIPIWTELAVYQLDLLEQANLEDAMENPQGVVLALVGPPDDEAGRSIRMYSLASLVSLVRWYVTQQDAPPLDLGKTFPSQDPAVAGLRRMRKSRHQSSDLARGFKSLVVDELKVSSPAPSPIVVRSERSRSPIPPSTTPPPTSGARCTVPTSPPSGSLRVGSPPVAPQPPRLPRSPSTTSVASGSSSWDVVDELPIRWASDFVPFAGSSSRLANTSVCFYQLSLARDNKMRTKLAVSTKTNILLYETEDRAFKFVKEFYTPLPAKSISFVAQCDSPSGFRSGRSSSAEIHVREFSRPNGPGPHILQRPRTVDYGTQPCLFVAFEKKAGLIRIGDAAVMEVESFPDIGASSGMSAARSRASRNYDGATLSPTTSVRRHLVASLDANNLWRSHPPWLPLVELQLPPLMPVFPSPSDIYIPDSICFITRGRTTQIYPCPLPMSFASSSATSSPLKTLVWHCQLTHLQPRVSWSEGADDTDEARAPAPAPPFLQVVGFGEDGVEVQEISFEFLLRSPSDSKPKGKAKAPALDTEPIIRAFGDVGGPAGALCTGGQWNKPLSRISPTDAQRGAMNSPIVRYDTWGSVASTNFASPVSSRTAGGSSISSHVTVTGRATYEAVGVYGWVAKGGEDYRVFWVGDGADSI